MAESERAASFSAPDPNKRAARVFSGHHSKAIGMTLVIWSRGPRSFMLIGRAPVDRLQALAGTIASRFDALGRD